jgi:geranyl-CoA carboxylase alpha subunit
VIEEAPSLALDAAARLAIGEAATNAARAVAYENAGTVEFLYDPADGAFYFLEMNTRIQVEHPVTECVTGLDLISLQFDIAEGKPLPFRQDDIRIEGAAIEARLYAEDPANGFAPQTGEIADFIAPQGVRIDAGVAAGDRVSAHYDPMIAKIVAHGPTREDARGALIDALRATSLFGLTTNREFLCALLQEPAFVDGLAHVGMIDGGLDALARPTDHADREALALCAALLVEFDDPLLSRFSSRAPLAAPIRLECGDGKTLSIEAIYLPGSTRVGDALIGHVDLNGGVARFDFDGARRQARFCLRGDLVEIDLDGAMYRYRDVSRVPAAERAASGDDVRAPMAGLVALVAVKPGDAVKRGDTLAIVEAMKMEHLLKAPRDGVVSEVRVRQGAQAASRSLLVALKPV